MVASGFLDNVLLGDGVTAILFVRSYRAALLLLMYLDDERMLDHHLLMFLNNEAKYLNHKQLKLYDCLAISILSKIGVQYTLRLLEAKTVNLYLKHESQPILLNYVGNVGFGFTEWHRNAVKEYLSLWS